MAQLEYSPTAKVLHWLVAFCIISEYLIGVTIDMTKWKWLHFQLGSLLLVLVVIRVLWRITHRYPELDPAIVGWNKKLAKSAHHLLYLLMLVTPLVGLVLLFTKGQPVSLLGIPIAALMEPMAKAERHQLKEVHSLLANAIFYLALAHALAAFYHQFIEHVPSLARMLPRGWIPQAEKSSRRKHER